MIKEIAVTYELYPPHINFLLESVTPSIEITFDVDIPQDVWEKYKDNEKELIEWVMNVILAPAFEQHSNKFDNNFNFSKN